MKHILFISPTNTLDNGAEISIYHLMELLVKEGHKVYNVTQQGLSEQTEYHKKKYSAIGVINFYLNSEKWWWEDAPGGQSSSRDILAASYRSNIKEIQTIITENQIDLVISNTVNVFQGAVAAAICQIPHYWVIHEFPDKEFSYYKDKCDFISDNSNEIFTVAGSLEEALKKIFPNRELKTFLPYNKLDDTCLTVGETERFVSIGRITERKNQLELLKAYQKLFESNKNLPELVFIGGADDDYMKKIKTYIKQHHLTQVSFLGHSESPWSLITDKDIMVFPSSMETFGMVYIESLLNGLPTIVSDNPGHRTVFDRFKVGELYESGNITQLSEKMHTLLNNHKNYQKQAIEAAVTVKSLYTIEQVYDSFLNQISRLKNDAPPKSLRHLENLLTLNQPSSRIVRLAIKLSSIFNKVKFRFKNLFTKRRG